VKKKVIGCAVKDCVNRSDQGEFVGLLCAPCHEYVAGRGDKACSSQAYRNASLYARAREADLLVKIGRDLFQRALYLDDCGLKRDPRSCLSVARREQLLHFLKVTP
jgi:hypothetical protein